MTIDSKIGLVPLITRLQWIIPFAVAMVGGIFIVANEILIEGRNPLSIEILLSFLVLCICGPVFAWITLNWAARAAISEEKTQRELARSIAENKQLYQAAQRRALHLETASLVGQRITALLDQNALLNEVAGLIRTKFSYYHTHIFLVEEETREIVLRAVSGPSEDVMRAREVRLKLGDQGITAWVAWTGQAVICNDVRREPRYLKVELLPETRAELAIPLRVGSRVIGVLDVQSNQTDSFDKEDITVLQVLGNQLGIAFENARLFAETRSRYEAMVALHETSLDVISQLDRSKVLNGLLRRGVRLWGAVGGMLMIYNREQDELYTAASYNIPSEFDVHMHPNEGLIGRVFETGKPMMVDDYSKWEGRIPAYAASPLSVVMAAPLVWESEKIGVVLIANDKKMRLFDQNDLWLLTLFAALAIIALRNAELHTRVKAFSQELEEKVAERTQELSVARDEIAYKADQLRSLLARTIHLQEEERARIAREMHDGVIQMLAAMRYELKAANVAVDRGNFGDVAGKFDQARRVLDDMEEEIRHAIYDLHPLALDAVDLIPALRKYAKNFEAVSGIRCELRVHGEAWRLPLQMEVAIFRIVEQGLQNIVSHARASETTVDLNFEPAHVHLEIQDNGRGFDPNYSLTENGGNHLGLVSMGERVRNLDGKMEILSRPGEGTHLVFSFPFTGEKQPQQL